MHHRAMTSALLVLLSLPLAAQQPAALDICEALSFPPQPPAGPPAIKPADQNVRVLAFGDFGDGGKGQEAVADAIAVEHKKNPFDFGITLGDNFYGDGLSSATDPRWDSNWEKRYGGLGIRLYASLGNHDYYDSASPIAAAIYSRQSKSWCLPASYYTYSAGPVQFFAIDTDWIMRASKQGQSRRPVDLQRTWLQAQLKASKATWKVVYGHHPAYSIGQHQSNAPVIKEILPLLQQAGVDAYVAGHDHDMQYLKPEGGVQFFINGAGGHDPRSLGKDPEKRRVWAAGSIPNVPLLGFSVLEASGSTLSVSFFDAKNNQLCKVTLTKGQSPTLDGCKNN